MGQSYDAILLVSFGGPERSEDVIPFLENVVRGRNVPRQRLLEVAQHYEACGGRSPINDQNRALISALQQELTAHGLTLPVYWGNRNWHPLLADTLRQMASDGIRRALALVTSAFSSYSGCRQYREDIARAQAEVGASAPQVDKLRVFFNHPGFIEPIAESVREAIHSLPSERRAAAQVLFTAHSIPRGMAQNCLYEAQLNEACRLVSEAIGHNRWQLVYQSRSGPPHQPWLEPDICDALRQLAGDGQSPDVIVVPIGFVSDHMEVIYDLDHEARLLCDQLGLNLIRTPTVGCHPRFVSMIRELIEERLFTESRRLALGTLGASHDVCPDDCCLPGMPLAAGTKDPG